MFIVMQDCRFAATLVYAIPVYAVRAPCRTVTSGMCDRDLDRRRNDVRAVPFQRWYTTFLDSWNVYHVGGASTSKDSLFH